MRRSHPIQKEKSRHVDGAETDYNHCIICQEDQSKGLSNVQIVTSDKLRLAIKARLDTTGKQLLPDTDK